MRNQHHMQPDELMKPDPLSKIVFIGIMLIVIVLLLGLARDLAIIRALSATPQVHP